MPRLTVKSGPEAGRSIEIDGEMVIGREGADLTIADPELSRRHARVRPVDGGVEIEDLGSTNGTFVNGERIGDPVKLTTGASVELGDSRLALELEPGTTAQGRSRRPLVALAVAVVAVAIAIAAVLALSGGSEETEARALNARVQSPPLSDLTSFQVAGVLAGVPLERTAVVIQRRLPVPPQRGGTAVPVRGFMLVTAQSGLMSLNFRGTLRVTRSGGEQLRARGSAANGSQEFQDVKGSFRLTGGRSSASSPVARYRIRGELEY